MIIQNQNSDFYYWYDETPNDWESAFRGSLWEYDEVRGQYYLHTFAKEQADLKWDNPAVRRAMKDVVDFWVQKGADGFRIDVIDCISKDFEKGENSLGPHLHEYINELFGRDEVSHIFTVGEGQTNDINHKEKDFVTIKAPIEVRELLGAEAYLYFTLGGKQCTARVASDVDLYVGMEGTMALDLNKLQLFDKDTELSLLWKEW